LLSPLCRVFTIIYLKQIVSLGYILLQLLYIYNLCYMNVKYVLYFHISTSRSMCAVPNMADFCSPLISCFRPVCCSCIVLSDFEMVLVASIVIGITSVFTCHMRCTSIVTSLYFIIFSASFLMIIFLSSQIPTSIKYVFLFHYQGL